MLTDAELGRLVLEAESDLYERKESAADRDEICRVVCAFANDLPDHRRAGILIIGLKDRDASCANLAITDLLLQQLSGLRANGNIYPFPSIEVQKRNLNGCDVIVVVVSPSNLPPVAFRGRVYVRVGPTTVQASPEDVGRLTERRRVASAPFDARPVEGASLDDLDLDFFKTGYLPQAFAPDVLERNSRTTREQLAALRLATPDGVPTTAGVLVLGRDPTSFIPGAYLQLVRYDGTDLSVNIKTSKELYGPISQILRNIDELVDLNTSTIVDFRSEDREIRRFDYPRVALQQLIRNAMMHRRYENTTAPVRVNWFADRLEIQNPGGPFGQVTVANFGRPGLTDYRNPTLAEAMKVLGYVQRFGAGIQTARAELAKNGNPDVVFEVVPEYILAVIRAK